MTMYDYKIFYVDNQCSEIKGCQRLNLDDFAKPPYAVIYVENIKKKMLINMRHVILIEESLSETQ